MAQLNFPHLHRIPSHVKLGGAPNSKIVQSTRYSGYNWVYTLKLPKKITFQGLIWVPKVSFVGFEGLVSIEKWSQNYYLDTQSATFFTPKMA